MLTEVLNGKEGVRRAVTGMHCEKDWSLAALKMTSQRSMAATRKDKKTSRPKLY